MRDDLVLPGKVVLIGPPGAGKSTVGGLLSRATGLDFTDTDQVIEEEVGKSIAEIFVEEGESFFREIEERVVLETLNGFSRIIALGGGSVMSPSVQDFIRGSGPDSKVEYIFLDVSIAHAAPRVGFNRERPLLMVNPRGSWQELMNKRRPVYEALATRTIDTNGCTPDEVVRKIVDGWRV